MNRFCAGLLLFLGVLISAIGDNGPMGVTSETGTTTFRVWAPNASSVAVIGDFNNWKAMQGDQLVKDEATGIWTGTFKRSLPKGAYQFLINGSLARRDPYSRAVTPDGRKSLFYNPETFKWEGDTLPKLALEDTIIYEMHIGSFFDPKPQDGMPATFADAAKKLDYLVELGVNTLCILPVNEFNGHHSWGYNPSDPFAVEQAYGGPDQLKQFVKECHARGLAVHLDIVHNHYGPQNVDLLQFDGTGNTDNGGIYFYEGEGIGMTPWGPRLKFESPMVQRYVSDNAMMWLDEYHVDGFRWDSTINIRAYNFGANPIPAGAKMLEDINTEIKNRFPGRWSIAEDSLNIGNFHGSWDYNFHHTVMPVLSASTDADRNMSSIAQAVGHGGGMPRVVYVDNHDEAGKINGMFRIASDIDPANPGSDRARVLSGLGAALTFTAPGIPLLFMGNEFQEYGTFHDDIPLDWGKTTRHAGLLALHRDLISMRLNKGGYSLGLKGKRVQVPAVDNEKKTVVYWRGHESNPNDQVVVVVNFSGQPAEVIISFPSEGTWVMRLNTDHVKYGGASKDEKARPFTIKAEALKVKTTLPAYSARIYSLVDRPSAAKATAVAAPAVTAAPAVKPPFSMYASIHLTGNFVGEDLNAWKFALVADYTWEGKFTFKEVVDPTFTLLANDEGVIFWGGVDAAASAPQNGSVSVKRLGKKIAAPGTWNGVYRFRFNEDALQLDIERVGDIPAAAAPAKPAPVDGEFRSWKDTRGAVLEAKLVEANETMVSLARKDGQRVQIPVSRFSEADQAYIRTWLEENE